MRDISKKLTVINTGKKESEAGAASQPSGVVYVGAGGGGGGGNLNDYLLKSIWNKVWEIRTDSQGTEYIFGKLPVVTQYGITMYSGDNVGIPTIAEGLPFDNRTIWFNPTTGQIEVIGGTGGGSGEGVSNFWDLSGIPSWITNTKPTYSYTEIQGTPDLSVYALKSAIPSLSGYATEQWVLGKGYALSSDLAKYIPIAGITEITGEKNFVGGLKVNGSPIYYDTEKKYWKLEGDLLVTGGVTMYGNDSEFVSSTIMDAILYDDTTLGINANGELYAKGGTGGGGISSVTSQMIVDALGYTPASVTALSGYLPLSGGTLSSTTGAVLQINTANAVEVGARFLVGMENKGWVGYHPTLGTNIYNYASKYALGIKDDGGLFYDGGTIWHSGNDGSGSGLDADLLDGLDATAFFCDKGASNYFDDKIYNGAYRTSSFKPNDAYGYGLVASFRSMETCAQIYFPDWNGEPQFRMQWNSPTSITNGWTALVTSSSIGNYNAGSATRIQAYQHDSGDKVLLSGTRSDNTYERCIYDNGWGLMLKRSLTNTSGYIATLNDNVASATKLQTARTIWGQSFNGTGNVDGTFTVTSNDNLPIRIHSYYSSSWVSAILATNTSLVAGQHFNINVGYGDSARNNAWVGYYHAGVGSTSNRLSMGLHSVDDVINILGTGNVGIGTTNPTEKLQVAGNIWSDGDISCKKRVSAYQNVATQLGATTYNIKNALYNGGQLNSVANNYSVPMLNWGAKSTNGQSTYFSIHSFHPTDGAGILIFGVANDSYGRTAFLEVQGSGLIQAGGNFLATGGITMYSDIRKKTKLKDVVLSLQQVANAPLIEHYYNSDQNKTTHVGSIAQYWAEMNDWFCKLDNEGYYTMEIQNAALASAISVARELVKFETETDRRIRLLEEENKRLKEEVEQLKWNIA